MSHDVADALHIGIFRNFDDQFIVDMSADETVFQVLHGIAENVAADSLGDILDVFRAVGFDPLPFLICADSIIFHAFPAEAVCADPGLHIAEPSAGWKVNKEHAGFPAEPDTADFCHEMLRNAVFYCLIDIPPEPDDIRIGLAPHIDERLELVF